MDSRAPGARTVRPGPVRPGQALDFAALEDEGAVLVPRLLASRHIAAFRAAVDGAIRTIAGNQQDPDAALISIFRSEPGLRQAIYTGFQNLAVLHELSVAIHRWLQACRFYEWAGIVAPACWPGLRVDIPSETKFTLPLHQDFASTRSHRAWRAWIPLSDASERTGSLRYYPGSHKLGPLPHIVDGTGGRVDANWVKDFDEHIVTGAAGDGLFFHPLVAHASVPNRGDAVKWTLLLQIQDVAAPVNPDDPNDALADFIRIHQARAATRSG